MSSVEIVTSDADRVEIEIEVPRAEPGTPLGATNVVVYDDTTTPDTSNAVEGTLFVGYDVDG